MDYYAFLEPLSVNSKLLEEFVFPSQQRSPEHRPSDFYGIICRFEHLKLLRIRHKEIWDWDEFSAQFQSKASLEVLEIKSVFYSESDSYFAGFDKLHTLIIKNRLSLNVIDNIRQYLPNLWHLELAYWGHLSGGYLAKMISSMKKLRHFHNQG